MDVEAVEGRSRRRAARVRTGALLGALLLVAGLVAPACAPGPGTYTEGRCTGTEGVTVVVDFTPMQDRVVVRCALGTQANGYTALTAIGLTYDAGRFPGGVCQIDGQPTQGYPYCWTTGGYWSYWKASATGAPWTYSGTGPTVDAIPAGAVEGWRFAPFSAGAAVPPRVGTSGPVTP